MHLSEYASKPRRFWHMMSTILGSSDAPRNEISPHPHRLRCCLNSSMRGSNLSIVQQVVLQLNHISTHQQCCSPSLSNGHPMLLKRSSDLLHQSPACWFQFPLRSLHQSCCRLSHKCAMHLYRRVFCH